MQYCPICKNKAEGRVCSNCGAILELEEHYQLNPYDKKDEAEKTGKIPDVYSTRSKVQPQSKKKSNTGGRKPLIIALCAVIALIVILVITIISVSSDIKEKNEIAKKEASVEEIRLKGEKYMNSGNYEDAEEIYKKLMDTSDDEEASTIYKILYNYNMAIRKLDDYNVESAARFFDKIPQEYEKYSIADDVGYLSDEISRFQTALEIFESIENFISDDNFSAAKEAIEILDEDALSKEHKERLKEIKEDIAKKEKEEIVLSEHDAEDLLRLYCDAMIKAINENNFDIVKPYIFEGTKMYADQKSLVEKCAKEGIKEKLNSFELLSLTKKLDTVWEAKVAESETISYANGESITKDFKWTYTIEYIDSSFYLTDIK